MSKTDPQKTLKMGSKGLIVFNPSSGDGDAGELKEQLRRYLGLDRFDLLELEDGMNLCEELADAMHDQSYHWIGAAGGDGTVSIVGSCLVDLNMPLVIIPSGTGNAIAGALGIPEDVEQACRLLLDGSETRTIDAIRIKDRYYFLQVGMGLEALTMEKTTTEQKNKLGELAYLWTAAREAIDWQPQQIKLTVDDDEQTLEASEVVLANIGDVGVFDLRWGEDIRPDDGRLDVVVIDAKSAADYAKLISSLALDAEDDSDLFTYFKAYDRVCIEAKQPLPFHGDGEEIKNPTPLEAHLVPGALTVIVPQLDS
ncbi:MAG: diacylglycerol/lipid kinase family protein [Candidatus Promineifilaceae bacterium]|jgi:diacylglycerol kinase (ATP)